MPYIYTQSLLSSEAGLPMTRALLVEFPEARGAWDIENQYLFGSDILVAPLFEQGLSFRDVYLPAGKWIDMHNGKSYTGGWHKMDAGAVQAIILIRDGTVLARLKPAQSTRDLDWNQIELVAFTTTSEANSLLSLPGESVPHKLKLVKKKKGFELVKDGLPSKVNFRISSYEQALIK